MAISSNGLAGLKPGVVDNTAARPASPFEGQMIYQKDTDQILVWNGSSWLLVPPTASPEFTGTPLAPTATAGTNTTQIATTAFVTAVNNVRGAYTAYTPTIGGFTLGNGTINTRYTQVNKMVHYYGRVTLGSTSVMTGPLDLGLPVNIHASSTIIDPVGVSNAYNNSLIYIGHPINLFNASVRFTWLVTSGAYATQADTGPSVPFTWASTHYFMWNFTYEAA
jgi:hypothetical protein